MSLSDWAAIAEIVAAIAVVVTLVYLAIQVRHSKEALAANTKAIRGQVISDVTRNVHEHSSMLLQGQDLASALTRYFSDDVLDSHDAVLMDFFLGAVFTARQNEYFQWRQGLLDEKVFRSLHHVIITCLESPNGQHWWKNEGRRFLSPDFVEFVDGLPQSKASTSLESWKRAVRLDKETER